MTLIRSIRKNMTRDREFVGVHKGNLPSVFFEQGYSRLSDNPEVIAGINVIADLVSNMTIRLMENDEDGHKRIHNELSRKLDVEPNEFMTRKNFIFGLTQSLLLYGNQITLPEYENKDKIKSSIHLSEKIKGKKKTDKNRRDREDNQTDEFDEIAERGNLINLHPISRDKVVYKKYTDRYGYCIEIDKVRYHHSRLLHFVLNPTSESPYVGTGYKVALKDLLSTLKQANNMKQTFMGGKYTPPLIISVASTSKKLSSKAGRDQILEEYVENTEAGKPMILPSDIMNVETVKPLTLKDVAVNETISLDKKAVASILGIPSFLLGVGDWKQAEFNNFVETKIASIAEIIQQEMTKKLIINTKWFVKFNTRSLKSFAQEDLVNMGAKLHAQGLMTGNEVRNWIDLDPKKDLNDLTLLENYIKLEDVSKQSKLNKEGKGGD